MQDKVWGEWESEGIMSQGVKKEALRQRRKNNVLGWETKQSEERLLEFMGGKRWEERDFFGNGQKSHCAVKNWRGRENNKKSERNADSGTGG